MYTQKDPAVIHKIREMGLQAFCDAYHIDQKEDEGLISLKYSMAESPMDLDFVQDCRGLIVRASDPTKLVAMPYRKFFNLGDMKAAPIHWASARVMEKLDGSLMILYFNREVDEWCVATSGHPTAGGPYNDSVEFQRFRDAFWGTFEGLGYTLPERPPHDLDEVWYFFELCRPDNRIVVKYERPRLVLHGARRRLDLLELSEDELVAHAIQYDWELVTSHPVEDLGPESVQFAAAATDPLGLEGFVVIDRHHNRIKVKNPRYVEIHYLRGNRSPRAVVDLVKAGEVDEILAHFPELAPDFDRVTVGLASASQMLESVWKEFKHLPRPEFAKAVKECTFSAVVFRMHSTPPVSDANIGEVIRGIMLSLSTPAILRGLKLKD